MLFWLFIIFLIVGIVIANISKNLWKIFKADKHPKLHDFFYCSDDGIFMTGVLIIIISTVCLVFAICFICVNCMGVDAKVEQMREQYRALEFKVDSQSYRDEFGLLNKEVIDEIQAWNEDVTYIKHIQRDFWLGIFWPNVYDEFQTIDYERY